MTTIITNAKPASPPQYATCDVGGRLSTGYGADPWECAANACANWLAWWGGAT